ncbi:methylthioribulose 1-phosphate dehydratase [Sphingosinicella soli]|uniref:Methylthioribulose-1-phosphate dehydratase n=1 Tax=Sphingosinicella soli TaxID=333708 RepID=A0A7W7F534_9SPHN|nr:methylthioribulose 1-phosphate dehydratase [Sphingosinicella soli]MBB4630980.1 methylthioribulose-1-phosphate dehydratase [Sphingosinicella soli]
MVASTFETAADAIVAVGRAFDVRGWAPATSGNYSVRLEDGSFAVTVSGWHKGRLTRDGVMRVDARGASLDGKRPSAETALHLSLYRRFPEVGAVLHSHSPQAVALSRVLRDDWTIRGHELGKAFPGVTTHLAEIIVPVVENSQDMGDIDAAIASRLAGLPPPAYLIRGHGLYGWGADIAEAERVIEATEWLAACEVAERSMRRDA